MTSEFQRTPIDSRSHERLAAEGLRLDLVDPGDRAAFDLWLRAEARGFHGPRPSEESLGEQFAGYADRRTSGVWDETAAEPDSPVATVSSWPAELTVPGRRSVTAWAISAVTVAPTHRRLGIARAMLEAELRTAHRLEVPVAMLTVSEATIYGRFGFAPSAMTADWRIDTTRAKWTGKEASGRVQFVSLEHLRDEGLAIVERVRLRTPGQMEFGGQLWTRLFGLVGDDKDAAKHLRAVRFDDAAGVAQGFAVYRITESPTDFAAHTLDVKFLVAATDDAYAGLWRFLLEQDLVSELTATLRPVDEAVLWQVSDFRAVRVAQRRDHLWTRILDVTAALEARHYSRSGRTVLEVSDPLGFAATRVLLDVAADGSATAAPFDGDVPDDAAAVALSVNALSALYLGGVSAVSLTIAGRITELREDSALAVDRTFRSSVEPWLSIWF
ncbi:GNAT family N-acetyltransferase [Lacisediminihabitans sp.]|uniref:GNAT family N-acetyltransferase n=1 Tax=Lacisediminihabitans sp. TaxID=2787631 RepID=UPI00374D4EBA